MSYDKESDFERDLIEILTSSKGWSEHTLYKPTEEDLLDKMYNNYPETKQLLSYIDIIVDGKFIEELKNSNLRFKGSSNQRKIMVKETMKTGKLTLWDDTIHTEFDITT